MSETRWFFTDLQCGDTHQSAWLDMKLRENQIVTLKDADDRKWRIKYQYPYPSTKIEKRRWNVGGIESEIIR